MATSLPLDQNLAHWEQEIFTILIKYLLYGCSGILTKTTAYKCYALEKYKSYI